VLSFDLSLSNYGEYCAKGMTASPAASESQKETGDTVTNPSDL
jgi:hypothetical protein